MKLNGPSPAPARGPFLWAGTAEIEIEIEIGVRVRVENFKTGGMRTASRRMWSMIQNLP
jgi:hypothetical protein